MKTQFVFLWLKNGFAWGRCLCLACTDYSERLKGVCTNYTIMYQTVNRCMKVQRSVVHKNPSVGFTLLFSLHGTVMSHSTVSLLFYHVYSFCHLQKEAVVSVSIQLLESRTETLSTTEHNNRTKRWLSQSKWANQELRLQQFAQYCSKRCCL